MKCFTLRSEFTVIVHGGNMPPSAYGWQDPYPEPSAGIVLDEENRCITLGWKQQIMASPELLSLDPKDGAISRNGRQVIVNRCSIRTSPDGKVQLVPEGNDDRDEALVLLDIGPGGGNRLTYTAKPEQVVASVVIEGGWGTTTDCHMLARLQRFDPVVATRTGKKWVFFGKDVVLDELTIKFDGKNVFYDTKRPRRW